MKTKHPNDFSISLLIQSDKFVQTDIVANNSIHLDMQLLSPKLKLNYTDGNDSQFLWNVCATIVLKMKKLNMITTCVGRIKSFGYIRIGKV